MFPFREVAQQGSVCLQNDIKGAAAGLPAGTGAAV